MKCPKVHPQTWIALVTIGGLALVVGVFLAVFGKIMAVTLAESPNELDRKESKSVEEMAIAGYVIIVVGMLILATVFVVRCIMLKVNARAATSHMPAFTSITLESIGRNRPAMDIHSFSTEELSSSEESAIHQQFGTLNRANQNLYTKSYHGKFSFEPSLTKNIWIHI